MSESAVYRPHPEEAAKASLQPAPGGDVTSGIWAGLRADRFELVSRGDFVSGMLHRPIQSTDSTPNDGDSPGLPLLLIQHRLGGSLEDAALSCAAAWVKRGLAVARIDLPLHGKRASPKLSDRLIEGCRRLARGEELDLDTGALVEEFARQSTSDLIRTIDALSAIAGIDANRIGYIGLGLGVIVGSYLLAHDPRPSAVVFALGSDALDAKRGPRALDAVTYLESAATDTSEDRQILFVAPEAPAHSTQENLDALFKAAPEPKQLHRFVSASQDLPKDTLQKIEDFLSPILKF
jgi:dienelactone hydrolase